MDKEKAMAIKFANCLKNNYTVNFDDMFDFCDEAIKALENSCEDTISRQQVLDIVKFEEKWLKDAKGNNPNTDIAFSGIMAKVSKLPLVTPIRKNGKWVKATEMVSTVSTVKCPICGREFVFLMGGTNLKFCPNCGSQMSYE